MIELPDLNNSEMSSLYEVLIKFGLPEGEFTFSPVNGGVLCFVNHQGLIWIPHMILDVLGADIDNNDFSKIGNLAGQKVGSNIGSAAGIITGTALSIGLTGGLATLPIMAGGTLGSIIGGNVMKKIGLQDPPSKITSYILSHISEINVIDSMMLQKMVEQSKSFISKLLPGDDKAPDSIHLRVKTIYSKESKEVRNMDLEGKLIDNLRFSLSKIFRKVVLESDDVIFSITSKDHGEALLKNLENHKLLE